VLKLLSHSPVAVAAVVAGAAAGVGVLHHNMECRREAVNRVEPLVVRTDPRVVQVLETESSRQLVP